MAAEQVKDPDDGILLLLRALAFAAAQHRDGRRKGRSAHPYINHPIEVAALIADAGGARDPEVLAAAVLHDTIEDTGAKAEELAARFGSGVAAMVQELSDDKSLPKEERKRLQAVHAPLLSPGAKLIKIADKTANIREVGSDPAAGWSRQRRLAYLEWAAAVVRGCRGVNAALEERFDEELERARAAVLRGG
jgi:guanosine-3',5'-bis(diphosphate) 3'-pyrophosphohydrolase